VALGCNQHACCIHPMVYIWYHMDGTIVYHMYHIYMHRENMYT
jgi:hypothetical protein